MQCDETISHMVTEGRSYFLTLRNACVTAGKTTMTAGQIYCGWYEMLSWPHRMSANIMNVFLVARDLYEMFVLYRGKHIAWYWTVGIWSEVRVYRTPATNILWAGGLYMCKFPDNWRLMCEVLLRLESPSGMCAKLHTMAASNNRVHAPQSLYYCLFVPHIYGCCSLHAFRSWWTMYSAQHQPRGCNNIPSILQRTAPIACSFFSLHLAQPWHPGHSTTLL